MRALIIELEVTWETYYVIIRRLFGLSEHGVLKYRCSCKHLLGSCMLRCVLQRLAWLGLVLVVFKDFLVSSTRTKDSR